jgi:hypothetical protein
MCIVGLGRGQHGLGKYVGSLMPTQGIEGNLEQIFQTIIFFQVLGHLGKRGLCNWVAMKRTIGSLGDPQHTNVV